MRNRIKPIVIAGFALLLVGTVDLRQSDPLSGMASVGSLPRREAQPPEQPQATVEVPDLTTAGRTIAVPASGDLQKAIDEARGGDRITLEPGATYRGPFTLPRKEGDGWIVIASAGDLPPPGRHVEPDDASRMPRLVSSEDPVFDAEPGAHHYRFVGLEIAPADGEHLDTLVRLGDNASTVEDLPHHVIVDRCYLHGDAARGARRGISLNARHVAVVDSYLADFKHEQADSQALAGWNGDGPVLIARNYLEAAGENVMFGGGDPSITGLVPSDIEIVGNHFTKPLRWKIDDPSYAGAEWAVKNLFELKNARRVLVDGNLFEYNWPHAQNGFAILFTPRNQEGGAPWSVVEDVTFSHNVVRHVAAGINILGSDDNYTSRQTARIAIRDNVFLDVGGRWGNGRLLQLLDGTHAVTVDHNTAFQTGTILFGGDHAPHTAFVFQNNVVLHNEHGVTGSGTAPGVGTLERYFPDAVFRRNVIVGGDRGAYPRDNFFPRSLDALGLAGGRAAMRGGPLAEPFAGAGTDGRDPGADMDAIARALDGIPAAAFDNAELLTPDSPLHLAGLWTVSGLRGLDIGSLQLGVDPAVVIFWLSLFLLAYVYAGYPLVAGLRARLWPAPHRQAPIEPSVSVLVVAYNEEDRIEARIENLLALDYPQDRLEIVVASDGSTDATAERARRYQAAGIRVRAFEQRRGKSAMLNAVVPHLRGEIVLFADARQRFEPNAVRALVRNFANPRVGAVSGQLMIATGAGTAAAGEGAAFYWRYEKFIRASEGRADSTVGATGAIYAIRRELFQPIPDDTILDDVLIPVRIVRQGYRVLFEPEARAYDVASASARQEFVRKARTCAGTFQLFAREPWLLNPWHNRLWFETLSHKGLRLTLPVLHAAVLLASAALAGIWFYQLALSAQLLFYGAALVGSAQRRSRRRSFLFSVPCAICLLSWASVIGFLRFVTNRQQATWERVPSQARPART